MTIGGILFLIGAGLQAGAVHLAMLIVGRIMLGQCELICALPFKAKLDMNRAWES
jgi:hypothetical protein